MVPVFAHPWVLWLLVLLPALSLVCAWAWRWRRRALARLGNPLLLRELTLVRGRLRGLRTLCVLAGLSAVLVGAAGPQWGRDWNPELTAGRDLVVVLDLSRSMLAEQPSRQERALRALRDLADTLQKRGGHRVALVAFAGRPKVMFPLTYDYDHFRDALAELDAAYLPPELRPDPGQGATSGTRLGAALRLAAVAHDPQAAPFQDILLLSDGDDPARDDEWAGGAEAARAQNIPVHVVGIGDPDTVRTIPAEEGVWKHDRVPVKTRLEEGPLQEIARRTRGVYVPARTQALPLGAIFEEVIEPRGDPAGGAEAAASLTVFRPRYAWFLGPALLLLALSMALGEGRSGRPAWPGAFRAEAVLLGAVALLLISAAPLGPVDEYVRRGNAAFAREEYEEALHWYERAEEQSPDPGLVAFNKAAALYRLERFREAEQHYRRSLEDGQVAPARKARGLYDLGNALLRQGGERNARLLERAVHCYRAAVEHAAEVPALRESARHNLELARLLWHRAKKAGPNDPDPAHKQPDEGPGTGGTKAPDDPGGDPGVNAANPDGRKGKAAPKSADGQKAHPTKDFAPGKGNLPVLPDQDELAPLSPEDVDGHLERIAQRIRRERREFFRQAAPPAADVKDW